MLKYGRIDISERTDVNKTNQKNVSLIIIAIS